MNSSTRCLSALRTALTKATYAPQARRSIFTTTPRLSPERFSYSSSTSKRSYSPGGRDTKQGTDPVTGQYQARPTPSASTPSTSASKPRGDVPDAQKLGTDFNELDVFNHIAPPATAVDMCLDDGFVLTNNMRITGGDGCLLVDGEAFRWRPWQTLEGGKKAMLNEKGQWDVPEEVWSVLRIVWPKPDLLIIGTGETLRPMSPETRKHLSELGLRVDVQDTRNAASQFNLLGTERSPRDVAAALIPLGWTGR